MSTQTAAYLQELFASNIHFDFSHIYEYHIGVYDIEIKMCDIIIFSLNLIVIAACSLVYVIDKVLKKKFANIAKKIVV